jgi:hypothetical protein
MPYGGIDITLLGCSLLLLFQSFRHLLELGGQLQESSPHIDLLGLSRELKTFHGLKSVLFRGRHGVAFVVATSPCADSFRQILPVEQGRLPRLEIGGAHHLSPFLGFLCEKLAILGGRQRERHVAELGEPRAHCPVG